MNCQFISIYGKFVTSQTASFSREDIIYNYTEQLVLNRLYQYFYAEQST